MDKKQLIKTIAENQKKAEKEERKTNEALQKENKKLVARFFDMWKKFSRKNNRKMKDMLQVAKELLEQSGRIFCFSKDNLTITTLHYYQQLIENDYFVVIHSNSKEDMLRFSFNDLCEITDTENHKWEYAENYFSDQTNPLFMKERIEHYVSIMEKLTMLFDEYSKEFETYIVTGYKTCPHEGISEKRIPLKIVEIMKKKKIGSSEPTLIQQ